MSQLKQNYQHFIAKTVALTVERTIHQSSGLPTISLDLREPLVDDNNKKTAKFDNETKMSLQLHPLTELPKFIAVLLTYVPKCIFSFHSASRNHGMTAEWDVQQDLLKITFLFAGANRFIQISREKVLELAFFTCDQYMLTLKSNGTVTHSTPLSLMDIEAYVSRAYRPFKKV
jgi:hypothetical protein